MTTKSVKINFNKTLSGLSQIQRDKSSGDPVMENLDIDYEDKRHKKPDEHSPIKMEYN